MKRGAAAVSAFVMLLLLLFLPAVSPAESDGGCPHQWELVKTVEPTCTKAGKNVWKCSLCGRKKTEKTDALGHDWAYCQIVEKPTCTKDGLKRCTCSRNPDHVMEEVLPATGHLWGDWITVRRPTYTETGLEKRTCGACDQTEYRKLPPLTAEWRSSADPAVTEDLLALFERAFSGTEGPRYIPVVFLASREADGTDRCFLALAAADNPEDRPCYVYIFLHEDPSGETRILNLVRLELGS